MSDEELKKQSQVIQQVQEEFDLLKYKYHDELESIYDTIWTQGNEAYIDRDDLTEINSTDIIDKLRVTEVEDFELLLGNWNHDPQLTAKAIFNLWYYQLMTIAFMCSVIVKTQKVIKENTPDKKDAKFYLVYPTNIFRQCVNSTIGNTVFINSINPIAWAAIRDCIGLRMRVSYDSISRALEANPNIDIVENPEFSVVVEGIDKQWQCGAWKKPDDLAKWIKEEYLDKIKYKLIDTFN